MGADAYVYVVIANAGAYANAGTAPTTARSSLSNREQEYEIGSHLGTTTINMAIRPGSTGMYEYCVFKSERALAVPTNGNGLPSAASITTNGLQYEMRALHPGRVVHYGQCSVTADMGATRQIKVPWSKYKLSKIRAGDYYGIIVFHRGAGVNDDVDIQTRTKELI